MEIAGYKKNPQDELKALSTFAEISCKWKKRTPFRFRERFMVINRAQFYNYHR